LYSAAHAAGRSAAMAVLGLIGLLHGELDHDSAVLKTANGNDTLRTYKPQRTAKGNVLEVAFRIEERDDEGKIVSFHDFVTRDPELAAKIDALQWQAVKITAAQKVQRSKGEAPKVVNTVLAVEAI